VAATTLLVGLLSQRPATAAHKTLFALRTAADEFCLHDSELYWLLREKQSESKLTITAFEKALEVRATFRGAKTITRLAARYPPCSPRPAGSG
jgi:uncharacterized protein (DUF1697 family)